MGEHRKGAGTGMRMGLRFDHTCELCLHFTRQTRPADSPVLASSFLPHELLRIFFPPISNAREFISLPHSYVSPSITGFQPPCLSSCGVAQSLILILSCTSSSFLLLASSFAYTTNSKFCLLWNKVDSCDLGLVT